MDSGENEEGTSVVYNVLDTVVLIDEDEGGSEQLHNIADDRKRARNESMLCIVEIHDGDIPELEVDEEDQAVLVDDERNASKDDAIINLKIDSPALRGLSRFFFITVQRIPRSCPKSVKMLLKGAQFFIMIAMFSYYLFNLGVFGNKTLADEEWGLTITSVKNILWNLRYPMFYCLGVHYFAKRHLEKVLSEIRLTRRYWRHVRGQIFAYCFYVTVFTVGIPISLRTLEMKIPTHTDRRFDDTTVVYSTVLSVVNRLLSLPVLFAFILVLYLLYAQARFFKASIQKWQIDMRHEARNTFIDIKNMVHDFEKAFQVLLVFYVGFLVTIFIPGMFSWFEMFQKESHYTEIYFTSPASSLVSGDTTSRGNLLNLIGFVNKTYEPSNNQYGLVAVLIKQLQTSSGKTVRAQTMATEHQTTKPDVLAIIRVVLAVIAFSMELAALYSPIILIGKINNCMRGLPETVRCLKYPDQTKHQYMFQTAEEVRALVSDDLSQFQGVRLLGMELTTLKSVILTLLMPFLTMLFHVMFQHVDLSY